MMNQPYTEQDALLRMTICGGEARVLLMRTTALSQKAGDLHNASDTAIAAMSRLMTGTAMLGVMMKEKDANVTVIVDGGGVGEVGAVVLNDRKILAEDGMVVVVLSMSSHDHQLLCDPEIVTRGFVYVKESEELLQEMRKVAMKAVDSMSARRRKDDGEVCRTVKSAVSSYLYKQTKRSPMIIPMVTKL